MSANSYNQDLDPNPMYCMSCHKRIYHYIYDKGLAIPLCVDCASEWYSADSNTDSQFRNKCQK